MPASVARLQPLVRTLQPLVLGRRVLPRPPRQLRVVAGDRVHTPRLGHGLGAGHGFTNSQSPRTAALRAPPSHHPLDIKSLDV